MKTNLLKMARKNFNSDFVPMYVNRHNRRQWVKSVRALGNKWLLAKPTQTKMESV